MAIDNNRLIDCNLYNQQILESIAEKGILPKAYLENNKVFYQGSNDGVHHQSHQINYISVNVINKPTVEVFDWINNSVKELVNNQARGIYPILIERDQHKEEFYNLPQNDFEYEIAQRISNSVLFVFDSDKLPSSKEKGVGKDSIIKPSPFPKSEEFLDKPILPEAIIHLFIPNAIKEIAQSVFRDYPTTFVPDSLQTVWISIPHEINVKEELLEEPAFMRMRSAETNLADYYTSISDFVHKYFQNQERKPLVFHVARLITPWLASKN